MLVMGVYENHSLIKKSLQASLNEDFLEALQVVTPELVNGQDQDQPVLLHF
jgi:hypothetical protein